MSVTLESAKSILITGGTGSFGQQFVQKYVETYGPKRIIVFSRDELKQSQMQETLLAVDPKFKCVRYFIGDVREKDRLYRAFDDVDIVVHAAALKQVPAAEYNPIEAIKTNIMGAANVIDAAIDQGVNKVLALSTDKAANPINLYGATKLCSDKLFTAARSYTRAGDTSFAAVRYGNVLGSRGSVVPVFRNQMKNGALSITDERMTRFIITLEQGVEFVMRSIDRMAGGEIFVPKLPSVKVTDIAAAMAPDLPIKTIGIRPGEKLHETMISEDDARLTLDLGDHFVILPPDLFEQARSKGGEFGYCDEGFSYNSRDNEHYLQVKEIVSLLDETGLAR
jgi:UDP-N-acetylglucosamine 4,6-dehydratase